MIEEHAPSRRGRTGRVLVTIIVIGLLAMWGYVVYLAFGPGRADSPDKIGDPAFAPAAEARCATTRAGIDALPVANAFKGRPDERADELEGVNDELSKMLVDLRRLTPAGEDGQLVGLWLEDWETYLADRVDYVARLRSDDTARLLVTEKRGMHITAAIDGFAQDNQMLSCVTPPDV
jgi:hypothetical protein